MKLNFKKVDLTKVKENVKTFFKNNYKMVGSAVVVASLCGVCTVNLANSFSAGNTSTGVVMTISDVAEKETPFAGEKMDVAAVSYADMKEVNYEAEQLANLEKSERQIDDVLSSRRQDQKDLAALDALTAQSTESTEAATEAVVVQTATYSAPVETTYADENGSYVCLGDYVLTAYCPCPICCGSYSNMTNPTTASGTTATAGRTIAADTSVLPFGTKVVIDGQVYTVEDRGGAIKGNRIDVFFNSHQEAIEFGRRVATVYKVQ